MSFFSANCHCTRGRPSDQRASLLRPFHVRGHPDTHPQFPARRRVARTPANQRRHARRWVHGVPPPVERHAVCLLHSCRHAWVYSRVSKTRGCVIKDVKHCLLLVKITHLADWPQILQVKFKMCKARAVALHCAHCSHIPPALAADKEFISGCPLRCDCTAKRQACRENVWL